MECDCVETIVEKCRYVTQAALLDDVDRTKLACNPFCDLVDQQTLLPTPWCVLRCDRLRQGDLDGRDLRFLRGVKRPAEIFALVKGFKVAFEVCGPFPSFQHDFAYSALVTLMGFHRA